MIFFSSVCEFIDGCVNEVLQIDSVDSVILDLHWLCWWLIKPNYIINMNILRYQRK